MISNTPISSFTTFVYYFTTEKQMEHKATNKKLFKEFAPVLTSQWEEKIIKDLKGKPYDSLTKKSPEGFDIKPFYREEDLDNIPFKNSLPGQFPFVRGNNVQQNSWLVRQDITVNNYKETNKKILDLSLKGVDSFGFMFPPESNPGEKELEILLENIRADILELNFSGGESAKILQAIDTLAKKYNRDLEKIKGSLNVDPLGEYTLNGHFSTGEEESFALLPELFKIGKHLPEFQLVTINAHLFHNAGGGVVSELAFALAMGAAYMTYLTDKGVSADEAASKIRLHFAVGSEYFMEIAKFRAFKLLWSKMVNAYGLSNAENAKAHLHVSSSLWNKTMYDPYVNMLRTTTETMSALIGGINSMTVLPFDKVFSKGDDFSERIARNQQLVLKEESYFDKVADPAAGSYYIENLTNELINQAWKLFLEVEEQGGYLSAFKKGIIQNRTEKEAAEKDRKLAYRKQSVLGVNQYPNIAEHLGVLNDESVLFPGSVEKDKIENQPLKPYRGAMAFEQLRYRTDKFATKNPRPKVWMFTYGNLAMRKARSQFAENFFGVAGFEIIDNIGFKTIDEGIKAARNSKPDIVVLCASDEDYETMAPKAYDALKNDFIVVLAGYPSALAEKLKAKGLDNFIHIKSNILEELKRYQKMLEV